MRTDARGFSLIETLVATAIVVVGLSGLAQLFIISSAVNGGAKSASMATILAQDKLEELLALTGSSFRGEDYLDAYGRRLGTGAHAPPGTQYIRRWSIEPRSDTSGGLCVWDVSVARVGASGGGEATLAGVRTWRVP
jgi:prepilin-type N-terminal cleavage/methylation domain-containing protein